MKILFTAFVVAIAGAYLCDFYGGITAVAILVFVTLFLGVCICALLLNIYNVLNGIYQQQKDARPPDDTEADTSAEQKTAEDHNIT